MGGAAKRFQRPKGEIETWSPLQMKQKAWPCSLSTLDIKALEISPALSRQHCAYGIENDNDHTNRVVHRYESASEGIDHYTISIWKSADQ